MHTVDTKEIQNFSKDADRWWDLSGPFAPLHRLNPARLGYIRAQAEKHFGLDSKNLKPFADLSILDIGCGGGLVCEPMARLGGDVTGIDADETGIKAAQSHATQSGLTINYRATSSDVLRHEKKRFDIVLALEIVEHVADVDGFVDDCVDLCKPGGLIIFSTLNRTAKSYALGIIAAEYILRWVPQGTHQWKKFLKPSELARTIRNAGGAPQDISGLTHNPLTRDFTIDPHDVAVNYFITATKAG